jgi:hypothetical protein
MRCGLAAGILLVATGCTESCLDYGLPGIVVSVSDSNSGAQASADTVTAVAADGSYLDSLSELSVNAFTGIHLAYERPGTYVVTVTATGYDAWQATSVRVRQNGCHVNPVQLDARLRLSAP